MHMILHLRSYCVIMCSLISHFISSAELNCRRVVSYLISLTLAASVACVVWTTV